MGFLRRFGDDKIQKMTSGKNAERFGRLKADVLAGEVFPAVRVDELHFYYRGGRLYQFAGGAFVRDSRYTSYSRGAAFSDEYDRAKAEIEAKFTNKKGGETERRLLDGLCRHTFGAGAASDVVVLDIEVNLGGRAVRKCDLVLLNAATDELMFVEGKVFSDRRVRSAIGHTPEVIGQVRGYSAAIASQRQTILGQYAEHIRIVNGLFGTNYRTPKAIVEPAKLLVYMTGGGRAENVAYTVEEIEKNLGKGNVLWATGEPTLREIWEKLT